MLQFNMEQLYYNNKTKLLVYLKNLQILFL